MDYKKKTTDQLIGMIVKNMVKVIDIKNELKERGWNVKDDGTVENVNQFKIWKE
jgi:hypothetical protein